MKQSEWKRRIVLDHRGVALLGAALTLNSKRKLDEKRSTDRHVIISEAEWLGIDPKFELDALEEKINAYTEQYEALFAKCRMLETSDADFQQAATLRVMDFRFRWEHLKAHPLLVGYLTDDVPDFAKVWPRDVPICKQVSEQKVIYELSQIYCSEFDRLTGSDPDVVPILREPEDFLFYLTVWKLCELEAQRGQPKGRRWKDGLSNATSYAWSLQHSAKESGELISREEAFRRALEKFKVVGVAEFEAAPKKGALIVSEAAGERGRVEGVKKSMRALWDKWGAEGLLE